MFFYLIMLTILILMIFISIRFTKKLVNPITIINLVYIIWMVLGRIGYLGQFKPSFNSTIFLQLNILIMNIFIIIGFCNNKKLKLSKRLFVNDVKLFNYLRITGFIISIAILFKMLVGILTGTLSLGNVRNISYSVAFGTTDYNQIYFNAIIYYVYQYLVRGFAFFDLSFCYANLIKKEEPIPFITICNFILFIIIMQSRIEFMKLVMFIIIFTLFSGIKLSKRQKSLLKKGTFLLGISVLLLFSLRTINTDKSIIKNTFDSFIIDFSGSNYMFSIYFDKFINGFRLPDSPLILKYLGGIGLLIEYFLAMFNVKFDHSFVNNFLGQANYIGSSDHYNAFYTIYFEFMNSGGMHGCIIFSIVFGFIIGSLYKEMDLKQNVKSTYLATFSVYVITMGTYNYVISGIYALMIFTCLFLSNEKDSCLVVNKEY